MRAIVAVVAALAVVGFVALTSDSSETTSAPHEVERVEKVATVAPTTEMAPAPIAVARPPGPRAIELPKDDYRQAKADLAQGRAVLLDVREQRTWDSGYIEGAVSFPWTWLQEYDSAEKLNTIPTDKIVYVYGGASGNAKLAANLLSDLGFDARPFDHSYTELAGRFRTGQ